MAIINKLNQTEVVQSTATQNSSNVTETKTQTSKPIDMTATEDKNKNLEILEYLNSDEFKNLSEEEQLKAFKEKYGLGLSDKELSETFKAAKKVAAEFAQRSVIEAGEDLQTTTVASSNDTAKAEIAAKQDIIETLKQQGVENPTQGDIYNYLVELEKSGAELTKEQAQMLKTYNALLDNGFQGLKPSETQSGQTQQPENQTNVKSEFLVDINTALSSSFRNKSPEEKLSLYMDAYLTQHDPEYANLSDKDKANYRNERAEMLLRSIGVDKDSLNMKTVTGAIALLEDSHNKGEIIQNFSDKSLADKVEIAASNHMKRGLRELLPREEFKNKSPREQMIALGDLLFAEDKAYTELSRKDKTKYIEKRMQEQLDKLGLPIQLEGIDEVEKREALTMVAAVLANFAESPEDMTIKKYQEQFKNPAKAAKVMLEIIPKTPRNMKLIAKLRLETDIHTELSAKGIEPTHENVLKHLQKKAETEGLSKEEQAIMKRYQALMELGGNMKRKLTPDAFANIACEKNWPAQDIVEIGLKRYKKDSESFDNYITNIVVNQPEKYQEIMKELNKRYTPEQIKKMFPELSKYAAAQAIAQEDPNLLVEIASTNPDDPMVASGDLHKVSERYMTPDNSTKFIELSLDDPELNKSASKALNDRDVFSQNRVTDIFKSLNDRNVVSDSALAEFTNNFMEGEKTNGTSSQLYFAEELAKLNNSAILEGVAAASKSIDSSVRQEYNNIINKALSSGNYSASDVQKITTALNTGTVAQQSAAASATASSGTAQLTANAAAAVASSAAQTIPTLSESATPITDAVTRAISENTPTAKTTASKTTNPTDASSAVQSSSGSSSAKKAEALNNAAETKANIDKAVKDWEKEHNTTISNEDLEALKSVVSTDVIDEILNDPEAGDSFKTYVKNLVQSASNINDLYTKLMSVFGSKVQQKFVDILTKNGNSFAIHNFAENNGKDVIKNLYMRCESSALKAELLNLLPPSTVAEMLNAGEISDLSSVDYKVLKDYIMKNISSMSNTEFNNYLKYLPFDERQALVKLRLGQTQFKGNEGGEIGAYAEKLGFQTDGIRSATQVSQYSEQTAAPAGRAGVSSSPSLHDDELEPFYDTNSNAELEEFSNQSDSDISEFEPGSDEWVSAIKTRQTGVKVPPSSMYAEYSPADRYFDWEIGSAGSTKLPFGRNYDKQKRGTVYWG